MIGQGLADGDLGLRVGRKSLSGIGMIRHVIARVLIFGDCENAIDLKNIITFYQYVIKRLILLLAVVIDRLKQR